MPRRQWRQGDKAMESDSREGSTQPDPFCQGSGTCISNLVVRKIDCREGLTLLDPFCQGSGTCITNVVEAEIDGGEGLTLLDPFCQGSGTGVDCSPLTGARRPVPPTAVRRFSRSP
jgi:coenzyme F420-reducing hydrogenase gamma subunit